MLEKKHTDNIGLVDSNMLVYMADATDKVKHEKAKNFLNVIESSPDLFVISLQNIREFCSVLIKKKKISKEKLDDYIALFFDSFGELLADSADDVRQAASMCFDKKSSFWDSLLVATMKRHKITVIYTENIKHFKNFNSIKAINPLA